MTPRRMMITGILLLFMYCALLGINAQETEGDGSIANVATSEKVQKKRAQTTFMGLVKQGGIIMFPMALLSIAGVGLVVYGFIMSGTNRMLRPELVATLQNSLDKLNLPEAINMCTMNPCVLTNILYAGLIRISDGDIDTQSMEKAMEEASVEETTAGLKPINYLSIIAQSAPMLGLLGTVSGMIKAFQKIGLGGMGDPEKLAADIGEAMVTTAAGLIVGIPAMFFYFYLKSKYLSNVSRMARTIGNLSHHVVAAEKAGVTPVIVSSGEAEVEEEGQV